MGIGDQQTQQRFPFDYDSVFSGLVAVVNANQKFVLKSQDRVIGRIVASAGMTAWSWGEDVSIAVERIDAASTMVTVASAPKMGSNLVGARQNSANLEGLIFQLSTYLQQHTAQGPVSAPAGWQRDPSGRHQLRYWDGSNWTRHISSDGMQGVDPPSNNET